MLLYRGFLLQDFLARVSDVPTPTVPSELGKKCRNSAISMAELAEELAGVGTIAVNSTASECHAAT